MGCVPKSLLKSVCEIGLMLLVWLSLVMLASLVQSQYALASSEVVNWFGADPMSSPAKVTGAELVGSSATELACLFMSAGFIKASDAEKTATALSKALEIITFPRGSFDRVSLLHFMAQVIAESDHLRTDEQYGNPSFDKKGWGMIQVTGEQNLTQSAACMDRFANGRGAALFAGPAVAVGNQAYNRVSSALMALCYWRTNIALNPQFDEISKQPTAEASRKLTQIVNAGGIGLKVTNGEKNLRERAESLLKIQAADGSGKCRSL